jgi:hypothetical protein
MNSLYNNLGPRRSRGGGGIFISISIVISLIIIFFMVYKLIQANKSKDDKDNNNKDDTVFVPEISPPVMGMVLMPDKDNTNTGTEQYEIDNCKLETYKIEYQTDINVTLSKNVKFSVDWNNTIGFNTVNSITFTHYIKSTSSTSGDGTGTESELGKITKDASYNTLYFRVYKTSPFTVDVHDYGIYLNGSFQRAIYHSSSTVDVVGMENNPATGLWQLKYKGGSSLQVLASYYVGDSESFATNTDYISYKTKKVVKPTSLGTDVISNYFKNGTSDNRFTFDGRAGDFNTGTIDYSVLGYNRIGISINYGDGDGTDIVVYGPADFNNDETSSAKVTQEDLAATFELLTEKIYAFLPEQTKQTSLGSTYVKNVYHVFPYNNNGFDNHFYSYLGKPMACTTVVDINSEKYMVSLNLVGASKDTFNIQLFEGDFNTPITDNSVNNYLSYCANTQPLHIPHKVRVGSTKLHAIKFVMIDPPTDITLPDTPSDKTGTTFLGYKTFKVIESWGPNADSRTDTFLVISNGMLTLKIWEDLTAEELPTMIMAFYTKK